MTSRKILLLSVLLVVTSLIARELRIGLGGSSINFVDIVSLVVILLGFVFAIFRKTLTKFIQNQVKVSR